MPQSLDTAWMELFVPAGVRPVRGVVAFIDRGLDRYAYDDRDWRAMCGRAQCALLRLGLPRRGDRPPSAQLVRNAALGGGEALLHALAVAAGRTGHPELRHANVLIFGFSAAGSFGPTFAGSHPERTIGFIRYHANLRGLDLDTSALVRLPALSIAGARDDVAGSDDARALWARLRARGAPWAHVTHIGQPHLSINGLVEAGPLMRDWTEAVLAARTPAVPGAPPTPIDIGGGWVVDDFTGDVAAASRFGPTSGRASWAPDERSALDLRALAGVCASVGLSTATQLLGPGTRLEAEDASVCHYSVAEPRRDLWLSARQLPTTAAAREELERAGQAANGGVLAGIGETGFMAADAQRACSTIGVARSVWTYYVALCGAGFGAAADSARLRPLAARLVGSR